MIDYEKLREITCKGIKDLLGISIVKSNQNKSAPDYPYISYTFTTLKGTKGGTYSILEDGSRVKQVPVAISYTVHSDDDANCVLLAMKLHDWFLSDVFLSDNGISVRDVTAVVPRDDMISIEYEYKKGFDVTFALIDSVETEDGFDNIKIQNYKSINFDPNKVIKSADGGNSADRLKNEINITKE